MEHSVDLSLLALLALALLLAKALGGLFERFRIPIVLAELGTGILLGNLPGIGGTLFHTLETSEVAQAFSELGVLFLLFLVGLETNLESLKKVGKDSTLVAIVGVVMPLLLTFLTLPFIYEHLSFQHNLFIGAALTATSVGITARVLKDSQQLTTPSGQIILGAAVIDDILGILILAIVTAIVKTGNISLSALLMLLAKMSLFIIAVFLIRRFLLHRVIQVATFLEVAGTVIILVISLLLLFAFVADRLSLAGIVGAFFLGVILDNIHFKSFAQTKEVNLEHLIQPFTDFFAPIFFLMIGMQVKLSALLNPSALGLGLFLTLWAIVGKILCGFVISSKSRQRGADKWLIGFGMIPRGEVGLIFAAMGKSLNILTPSDYSAVIMMVTITTLMAPPLISLRARRI